MNYSISIKFFLVLIFSSFILGLSFVFFSFHNSSKASINSLLVANVQVDALNLKHFLDTNLQEKNIKELKSHLDTICTINDSIENIYVQNSKHETIYYSNREFHKKEAQTQKCTPIFDVLKNDELQSSCYTIRTKSYNGLTPHFYHTDVYLSQNYIDSLFRDLSLTVLLQYIVSVLLFFVIGWFVVSRTIKNPLEKLRQFAYYENKAPKPFYIQEIESVRYSFEMTLKRLYKEQQELYNLSTRDQLSGLYNKRSLIEKIEWLISNKNRKNESFAVIMLDLDNFKTVNDSMGHHIGDKVLQEVSDLLLNSVRSNDIVARMGGDEFAIILPEIDLNTQIIELLERLRESILAPMLLDSLNYQITASMGIAVFPKDGTDANSLLKNADIAMYKSKELGKNTYHFYTESFNVAIQEKLRIQNLLIDALSNDYFELHYQPKVDLKTNTIKSCEALLRLNHPKAKGITPADFIPIAEENNLIVPIGEWVIQESVRQLKAWKNSKFKEIIISINFSAKQFHDPLLIQKLTEYTQGIEKSKLDIELTESVFIENYDHQNCIINEIKELGFSLSLDDFGTGYSSLSYLKNIPFNTLKIDKSFIDELEDKHGQAFVIMICNIAKSLSLDVVAEGVESIEQRDFLASIECDYYQGYFCSKPLSIKKFEQFLVSQNYL